MVGALALVSVSCSSGPSEALAFEDPASRSVDAESQDGTESAGLGIDAPGDVVAFQATWLCELQRTTFPDLNAIDEALDDALLANGLSRVDYDEFLADLADSQSMRDEVLSIFEQRCRA